MGEGFKSGTRKNPLPQREGGEAKPSRVRGSPSPSKSSRLPLHHQFARIAGEGLGAIVGHLEAFADFDAPAVAPDAGDAVQGHARLEHGLVAGAQADRVLAPVGRLVWAGTNYLMLRPL